MVIHKAMITLVLTWGMQQESFLAWNIGAHDPYVLLLYWEGGDYHIQAPKYPNLVMA
jgi:hypothetical protein